MTEPTRAKLQPRTGQSQHTTDGSTNPTKDDLHMPCELFAKVWASNSSLCPNMVQTPVKDHPGVALYEANIPSTSLQGIPLKRLAIKRDASLLSSASCDKAIESCESSPSFPECLCW